jgi:hypothetical protein
MKIFISFLVLFLYFGCNNFPPFNEKEKKEKEKEKTNGCLFSILLYTDCINSQPNNLSEQQKHDKCVPSFSASPCTRTGSF